MPHITDRYFDELVANLQRFLRIDTVKAPAEEGAPFGKGNAECLKQVLALANEMGFETVNCDNYAGHVEFGEGEEVFGVLGHLDVVPVTAGEWSLPPFGAEIKDGFIYARGTLDDKGPIISCLYALKALKDEGFVPKKKIRVIFGCDEESGWECMRYYAKKFPMPQTGFSPDGNFPLINREKGVAFVQLGFDKINENIIDIFAGDRLNIVPDAACAKIRAVAFDKAAAEACGVKIKQSSDVVELTAQGVSCHASTPHKGDNAIWKIFKALHVIFPQDKTIDLICKKLCQDNNGVCWGLPFEDAESGKITHNLGKVRFENSTLTLGFDFRYPVTYTSEQLLDAVKANTPDADVKGGYGHNPLFVKESEELVQKLLKAYHDVTGLDAYTIAVGGATYARCLPCGVAFGPAFPDGEKNIHCVDECISLDLLRKITKIYYEAIKALAF